MRRISYYYQQLSKTIDKSDDMPGLIDLHVRSFVQHGWEPVLVTEEDARKHPLFELFDDETTVLYKSRNPKEYTRACYMRWLAYAVAGDPFADFDVINYGFTPEEAVTIKAGAPPNRPVFISAAGAVGLLDSEDYSKVLDVYQDFIKNPIVEGDILQDINDMTILRQLRSSWYNVIPYPDDRFSKDYLNPGWETTKLAHFPYATTPSPRFRTILSVRDPLP